MPTQMSLKTKMCKIHQWMFRLTVPPKIILPEYWLILFATSLDSTNPVVPALPVCGSHMAV